MATDSAPERETFSSPSMRARSSLVRALALTDELERAYFHRDAAAVRRLCAELRRQAQAITYAADDAESWGDAGRLDMTRLPQADADAIQAAVRPEDQAHPMTEAEKRAAWGDR